MLKIERLCHNREVTIRLRTKDPVFTKHLVTAIALSLFLHLLAAITIEIRDSAPPLLLPLPQLIVETDLGLATQAQESSLAAETENDGLMPRYVVEPEAVYPEMPRMPLRPINRRYISERETLPLTQEFSRVERLTYIPDTPHFSFIRHYEPVRVHVSGELATLELIDDAKDLLTTDLERPHLMRRCTTRFRVQVDTRRGKVFWFDPVLSCEDEELDQIAAKLVSALQFSPRSRAPISEGEIEIQFQVKHSGPYHYLLADQEPSHAE